MKSSTHEHADSDFRRVSSVKHTQLNNSISHSVQHNDEEDT